MNLDNATACPRRSKPCVSALGWWFLSIASCAAPAAGDWLITLEGRLIETRGVWTVDGEVLTYTDPEGVTHTLGVAEVDLEASVETTALRSGTTPAAVRADSEPAEAPAPAPAEAPAKATEPRSRQAGEAGEAKVRLYVSALCRECTKARQLLEELGVDFVVRDVTKKGRARREYQKIAGHGGGLPVIDFDGRICFSYNPGVIRQRVKELREKEPRQRQEAGGS